MSDPVSKRRSQEAMWRVGQKDNVLRRALIGVRRILREEEEGEKTRMEGEKENVTEP